MNAQIAVAKRIKQLCSERGIAINALAKQAGLTASSVYSLLNGKSKNPGIVTIQRLCDGLGISLKLFFDDKSFQSGLFDERSIK